MRTEIIAQIQNIMRKNKDTYFLTNDLGYSVLEHIEKEFPTRFINVGIAEQNLIGVAAGLALSGKKVFVYSICTFLTLRCFEQIRNDIAYHNLPVILLGMGAGLAYGVLGHTHFSVEDIAIMRTLPNMTIISPADALEAKQAIQCAFLLQSPTYLRIGKKQEPKIFPSDYTFQMRKNPILQKGKDIVIFSTGTLLSEVLEAADILTRHSISSTVMHIPVLKPVHKSSILSAAAGKKGIFSVEEHGIIGGLGSVISDILITEGVGVKMLKIGIPTNFKNIGTQSYLREKLGLDKHSIAKRVLTFLK